MKNLLKELKKVYKVLTNEYYKDKLLFEAYQLEQIINGIKQYGITDDFFSDEIVNVLTLINLLFVKDFGDYSPRDEPNVIESAKNISILVRDYFGHEIGF